MGLMERAFRQATARQKSGEAAKARFVVAIGSIAVAGKTLVVVRILAFTAHSSFILHPSYLYHSAISSTDLGNSKLFFSFDRRAIRDVLSVSTSPSRRCVEESLPLVKKSRVRDEQVVSHFDCSTETFEMTGGTHLEEFQPHEHYSAN